MKKRVSAFWRVGLIFTLLISLVGSLVTPSIATSTPEAVVFLEGPPEPVKLSTNFEVKVKIGNVSNLYGAEIHLKFNPNLMEVVDADGDPDNGTQIGLGPVLTNLSWPENPPEGWTGTWPPDWPPYFTINSADNDNGTITFAFTLLNPMPPLSISDARSLAIITFHCKAAGEGEITFSNPVEGEPAVKLADSQANPISYGGLQPLTISQGIPSVVFSSATYSVNENAGTATITVNLSAPSNQTVTVNYATSDGTATAGQDYEATSGTLTFNPGETSKSFTIPILEDSLVEGDETVNLALSNPVNATLGTRNTAVLTIIDNEKPQVIAASKDVTKDEAFSVDITAQNVPSPGLAGFNIKISYNPNVAQITSIDGPDPVFATDAFFDSSFDNTQGVATIAGARTDGVTGTFRLATLNFTAVGAPGDETDLVVSIKDFVDPKPASILVNPVNGKVRIRIAMIAKFSLGQGVDIDKAAVLKVNVIGVYNPATGELLPDIKVAGLSGELLYDPDKVEILGIRTVQPFVSGEFNNVEPGKTLVTVASDTGQSAPTTPLYILVRLKGSALTPTEITLNPTDISDAEGKDIAPAPLENNPERKRAFHRSDINGDGSVKKVSDAVVGLQFIVGKRMAGDETGNINAINMASINHDGDFDKVAVSDIVVLLQWIVGKRNDDLTLK